jgi:O-6-methylguanine DNA methyltransferase
VLRELREYLAGNRKAFSASLDIDGTPFQKSVWEAILTIPYGETLSYVEVATMVGRPTATRAVGQAVGANPVPIIIPCHRVIGKNGSLTGYGGGLPLKERLLALEQGSLDL